MVFSFDFDNDNDIFYVDNDNNEQFFDNVDDGHDSNNNYKTMMMILS